MRSTYDSQKILPATTTTAARHVFKILSLSDASGLGVCNLTSGGLGVVCMHDAKARRMFEGLGWETHVVRGDEGGRDVWWLGSACRCLLVAGLGAWLLLPASVGTRLGLAGSALWLFHRFRRSATMMIAHRPWLLEAEDDRVVRLSGSVWSPKDWLTPSFAQIVSYRHIASGVRFVMVHLSLARRGAADMVEQAMEHAEKMARMVTLSGTTATLPMIIGEGSDTSAQHDTLPALRVSERGAGMDMDTAPTAGFAAVDPTSSLRVTRHTRTAGGIESTISLTLSPRV